MLKCQPEKHLLWPVSYMVHLHENQHSGPHLLFLYLVLFGVKLFSFFITYVRYLDKVICMIWRQNAFWSICIVWHTCSYIIFCKYLLQWWLIESCILLCCLVMSFCSNNFTNVKSFSMKKKCDCVSKYKASNCIFVPTPIKNWYCLGDVSCDQSWVKPKMHTICPVRSTCFRKVKFSQCYQLVSTSASNWFTKGHPCVIMSMW